MLAAAITEARGVIERKTAQQASKRQLLAAPNHRTGGQAAVRQSSFSEGAVC